MTIKEFLEEIIRVFKKAGVECAEAEARMLACHVLSCSPAFLVSHADDEMDDKVLLASAALINERCKGRPIQYVLGTANFYGIDLAVDERVLIPRQETELLAEEAIAFLKERPFPKTMDLCTGSGAIAAAMAANVPNVKVIATELSPKAFMLACVNLRPYENVKVLRGDLFEALEGEETDKTNSASGTNGTGGPGRGSFDAILTNPPYIPADVISTLNREVKDYEPRMALDGGADGLDIIRRIIKETPDHLKSGGMLLMEIGHDQGTAVIDLAAQTGVYCEARIIKDLEGHDRMLRAVRI